MTTPTPPLSREQRRRAQKLLGRKAKPQPRRYASQHMLHTQWDVLTASPTQPMAPERYRAQLTKMHLALDAIARSASPERSEAPRRPGADDHYRFRSLTATADVR